MHCPGLPLVLVFNNWENDRSTFPFNSYRKTGGRRLYKFERLDNFNGHPETIITMITWKYNNNLLSLLQLPIILNYIYNWLLAIICRIFKYLQCFDFIQDSQLNSGYLKIWRCRYLYPIQNYIFKSYRDLCNIPKYFFPLCIIKFKFFCIFRFLIQHVRHYKTTIICSSK